MLDDKARLPAGPEEKKKTYSSLGVREGIKGKAKAKELV